MLLWVSPKGILPAGERSLRASCPLSSRLGRSGALGKLLEFRVRLSLSKNPVRDQRECSDLTYGGALFSSWRSDTGLIGRAGTGILPPNTEEEGNVQRRGLWKGSRKAMGEEVSGAG